jgi:hypothetical protein
MPRRAIIKTATVRIAAKLESLRSPGLTERMLPKRKLSKLIRTGKRLKSATPAPKKTINKEPKAASSFIRVSLLKTALPRAVNNPAIKAPIKRARGLGPNKSHASAIPGSTECESASPIKERRLNTRIHPKSPPLRLSNRADNNPRSIKPYEKGVIKRSVKVMA